ncbi:hypothetical protein [uncultured Proteiniphilum sp.]|uniref:hypothetical protein n=1 Tax=uncultured Proteiniphilum sp. TaxID=497637 RepID=UPI0026271E1E|nr:hypothetical protein [uncultured Proteiniphilum sp.]
MASALALLLCSGSSRFDRKFTIFTAKNKEKSIYNVKHQMFGRIQGTLFISWENSRKRSVLP